MAADRISAEIKRRKIQEAVEKESTMKGVKMSDEFVGGLMELCCRECANADIACNIRRRTTYKTEMGWVFQRDRRCDFECDELERGWIVVGFN